MGRDEQIEEREVLDAIFPDEIVDISDTSYRISIVLDITQQEDDESVPPTLLLTVTYPPAYPDAPPLLEIATPPGSPKHIHLNIQDDHPHLLAALQPTITENMGMAMIFSLVSSLKDSAEQLIAERQAVAQTARDAEAARAEEEENRKFHGTAVTPESFSQWRLVFRREMEAAADERRREEKERDEKGKRAKVEQKMTGRQLWERGLVGDDEDDGDGADEDGLRKGLQTVKLAYTLNTD